MTDITLDVGKEKGYPQARFYLSTARYPAYISGTGGGKSTALIVSAFRFAGEHPGSIQLLTEPSHDMIRIIMFPKINEFFSSRRGKDFTMTESPPIEARFANGSQIWFRSSDVRERLYGPDVARVLMDEVTIEEQEAAYLILLGRIRQKGFPNQLLITGTPKGRNWVYKRYIHKPMKGIEVFTSSTEDNQYNPPEYFESLLEAYGGWESPLARQELGAAWVQMAGQVFPQFSRTDHIRVCDDWRDLKDRMGGIDFGGVSPTALIAAGLDGGRIHAYAEWYKAEATLDQTMEAMNEMREKGISKWVADPSGKKEMEILRRAGFDVIPARHGNKIALRAQLFGARLNINQSSKLPGMFFDPSCPNLINEVEGLSWRRTRIAGTTEMMSDKFDRLTPDHAFDSLTNVVAEYDSQPAKIVRSRDPIAVYGRY